MNEKVNQIISELIALDPAFGAHKEELEKILLSVVSARPETVIDSAFVQKLKLQLFNQLDSKPATTSFWSMLSENLMKKTILSAASVIVVLLVAIVTLQAFGGIKKNSATKLLSFGSDVRITHASDGAFGNLATLTLAAGGSGGGGAAPASAPLGSEGTRSSIAYGMGGGGGGVAVGDKMIAPYYEPVTYKYTYKGEALNLTADKLDVLKKQTPNTSDLAASLNSLGLGLVNLNSFPGSRVQSVSFNQDNGYNMYVDLNSGMISISGYYDVWTLDKSRCTPEGGCPMPDPVKESDIPSDAEVIAAANQFLADHGISTSAYGAPEVSNDYRDQIRIQLEANPKSLVYWPESVNVIYPLKIQNDEVYDEGGNKSGLMVGVGVRSKKVVSVWNLSINDYQASSYDAETDAGRILKIAENGGMYGWLGEGGKVVEIELGTPTVQYVQMWDYKNNSSQQLLVPSLIFPVIKQPTDGSFYRKAVVVPLIKDILARDGGGFGGGGIPMPVDVPATVK